MEAKLEQQEPDFHRAILFEYVVVFTDHHPPHEASLSAVNDEHAIGRTKSEYPGYKWVLYRQEGTERLRVCCG